MRVLLFSTAYFPLVGGAEIAVKEVTNRLPDIEFEMVTPRYSLRNHRKEHVGNILVHRVGWGLGVFDKFFFPRTGAKKAAQLHHKRPFHIIHAIMATYGGAAASAFKKRHGDIPMILTLQEGQPPEEMRKKTRLITPLYHNIFKRADCVTVISTFLKTYARSNGVPPRRITLIPNGVTFDLFSRKRPEVAATIRQRLSIPNDAFVVSTVSRLEHKNGVDTLIDAVARCNDENLHLLIVGDGSLRGKLQKQAARQERIHFLGTISHNDLPGILWASNAFVRLSRSEGLGNAFLEAMAAGCPIIATPAGGIPDFLTHEKTGLLVERENIEKATDAIKRLRDDDLLRKELIDAGRELIRAAYAWDDIAKEYEKIYALLL